VTALERRALVSLGPVIAIAGGVVLAFAAAHTAEAPGGLRIGLAAIAVLLLVTTAGVAPRWTLYALLVWLSALALVRRLASTIEPAGSIDPLLVVGPIVAGALVLVAADRGAFTRLTALSKTVLLLSALLVVGALNPLQSSLLAGVGALFFLLVPTLGFWIGRGLCDDAVVANVFRLVAGLAIGVAAYGLVQVLGGMPSWDAAWVRDAGYPSLRVGEELRAFGPFSSSAEYAYFLALGLAAWLAFTRKSVRLVLTLGAVALLATALFYAATRGVVFAGVAGVAVMAAARSRVRLPGAVAAAATLVLLLPIAVERLAPASPKSDLVAHQIGGLADPLDRDSSVHIHLELVEDGIRSAVSEPLGVTIAGDKFGSGSRGTETDISNMALALGFPGLFAYAAILVFGVWRAYALARARRDAVALLSVGILMITLLQWLAGGHYAVALLVWLVLGWVDRSWAGMQGATGKRRVAA
jgi:hypothetical protein